jgi:hypothetical protein
MKNVCRQFTLALACVLLVLLLTPFEGSADQNTIHSRGWIGGRYLQAKESYWAAKFPPAQSDSVYVLPEKIKAEYSGGIFVARVFAGTPAAIGGLSEGELLLCLNERALPDLKTFYAIIDAAAPGSNLRVRGFRQGEIVDHHLVVGQESYKKVGRLELFLGFGGELDIIPNPDFSIFSLISFKRNKQRLELNAPDFRYYRDNLKSDSSKEQYALQRSEGWDFRLIPFGVGRTIEVLAQDVF